MLGTFLKGSITGLVTLGVVSWLVSTFTDDEEKDASEEGEE